MSLSYTVDLPPAGGGEAVWGSRNFSTSHFSMSTMYLKFEGASVLRYGQ